MTLIRQKEKRPKTDGEKAVKAKSEKAEKAEKALGISDRIFMLSRLVQVGQLPCRCDTPFCTFYLGRDQDGKEGEIGFLPNLSP